MSEMEEPSLLVVERSDFLPVESGDGEYSFVEA